ncbi:hypothetical protein DYH09_06735 [bacterium CPR1]|nr:hypothetical protein [bacterium CPR1]
MGRAVREHSSAEPVRRVRRSVEGLEKKTRAASAPRRRSSRAKRSQARPLPWGWLLLLGGVLMLGSFVWTLVHERPAASPPTQPIKSQR